MTGDLRRYCGLDFVTSSLEKKAETAAIKVKIEQDSTSVPLATPAMTDPLSEKKKDNSEQRRYTSAAYEIAVATASYLQSRAKDLISLGSEPQLTFDVSLWGRDEHHEMDEESANQHVHKSEMAACVAASTMTAVVAADEKQKQEAARDLQSLHSSPCDWFVCDDSKIYTRCFVIQGSDSMASWQANLLFEPTKFEKLLYSPVGKMFILQPNEKSSSPLHLLPSGSALYALENTDCTLTKRALRAFLNSPHPLETLSDPKAYGSDGTIIRDLESSNYQTTYKACRQRSKRTEEPAVAIIGPQT